MVSMKADRYLCAALSVLLCWFGTQVLLESVRHAGPYADEYVLLGAALTALGLAALWMVFEQYRQVRLTARRMRRESHFSRRSRSDGRAGNS
jgi:hypothetical protein